ncbi:MAG: hypothetical protein MK289_21620 [Trichodesmium sp. ALOHA_ZT_67]|uniref:hypothetical protein n=1 Tax=Trichodesmium erythraeum TaxID=1206 RepID=UPI000324525B|nr:hypothetical protein [Trichodesmium sp. ALOHA_ZT_67]
MTYRTPEWIFFCRSGDIATATILCQRQSLKHKSNKTKINLGGGILKSSHQFF